MHEPFVAGCHLRGVCGEGPRQLCVSVPRIKMKRWRQSTKHWTNAAQNIRYFMKMRWISILIPKSVRTGSYADSKKRVVTPRQNEKYYLAGALHCGTGKVSYVGGNSKSSAVFISLLKRLKATYRRAKTITLILDNYIIHKSRETQRWLKENPKFRLIFQPVYSPG